MNEPLRGKELEEAIKDRQIAREIARDAAMQIDSFADYDDSDEDDIRPY